MQVQTANGLIDFNQLDITDTVVVEDNARITATEWRHGGELVRRDVNVNILRGVETLIEGDLNG
jgi:hypothetical protein